MLIRRLFVSPEFCRDNRLAPCLTRPRGESRPTVRVDKFLNILSQKVHFLTKKKVRKGTFKSVQNCPEPPLKKSITKRKKKFYLLVCLIKSLSILPGVCTEGVFGLSGAATMSLEALELILDIQMVDSLARSRIASWWIQKWTVERTASTDWCTPFQSTVVPGYIRIVVDASS